MQVLCSSGLRAHTQAGTHSSGSGVFSSGLTSGKFRTALDKAGTKAGDKLQLLRVCLHWLFSPTSLRGPDPTESLSLRCCCAKNN